MRRLAIENKPWATGGNLNDQERNQLLRYARDYSLYVLISAGNNQNPLWTHLVAHQTNVLLWEELLREFDRHGRWPLILESLQREGFGQDLVPDSPASLYPYYRRLNLIDRVLIVCSGNTCRSPMAAALLQRHLRQHGHITVESAGTGVTQVSPATDEAIAIIQRQGIDLQAHRSRPVEQALVRNADLILTMEPHHASSIRETCPQFGDKVFTIGEFLGTGDTVADPLSRGLSAYEQCAGQLDGMMQQVAERITR